MVSTNFIMNDSGEQFNTHTARRFPYGTMLMTQDGRKYRYGLNGAVALVAGRVIQSEVPGANFDDILFASVPAIGDRSVTITTGATATTLDMFAGGYMVVQDDTGEGHTYLIEGNAAAATTSSCVITLAPPGIRLAPVGATTVLLVKHPTREMIIHPSPPTALVVGATGSAMAASVFGWIQSGGPAAVLFTGTAIIGENAVPSLTVDGSLDPYVLSEAAPNTGAGQPVVAWVAEVAVTTEMSFVWLRIDP